jgi:class 3 adenylate cyclase
VGFTKIAEKLLPKQLLIELDGFFTFFDFICEKYNLEKLKTIGDSYMCAGGLPTRNYSHPIDICLAALEFRDFALRMQEVAAVSKEESFIIWELRIGIHTGSVIGGVIGTTKFAYDVWGDTVNIASRVESSGMPNRINVSGSTYELVKDLFTFEYRGKVSAKNKGSIDMYFLNGIRPEFSKSGEGIIPNQEFWDYYREVVNRKILLEKTKQEVNI